MNDFADRYAALCRTYAERLPARLLALRAQIDDARARRAPGALGEARDSAHKLHGTAGSYGFAEVTAAFGAVERAIDELVARGEAADPDWSAVDAALDACERAIARISEGRTS
jgi:HPt (histidine-containing phosphotransfer) domain-containing protein